MQKRYYDVRVAILMWHVIINVCDYHQIFKCNVPGCVNGCFVVVGASAYQFGSCVENVPQIYTHIKSINIRENGKTPEKSANLEWFKILATVCRVFTLVYHLWKCVKILLCCSARITGITLLPYPI